MKVPNSPYARAPLKVETTSPLQQKAAMRVKSMFEEQRDDPTFRKRFNEGWNPAISRSPEMDNLDRALALADEIDKVHAAQFSRYSAEQKAKWRKALAERQ